MERRWRLLLPPSVRTMPADLAAVTLAVAATLGAVFLPGVRETPLRVALGLPFVLFVPGYALVAALFPGTRGAGEGESGRSGISGLERIAFAFGTSIAVVPLVGLALNATPWGIRLAPVTVAIAGVTLASVAVAARRRRALPEGDRFRVPYRRWVAGARDDLLRPTSTADLALNVLLAASLVLATVSVGYAVGPASQGERYTEFYLLSEGPGGDLVADDYPRNFTAGETRSVYVGVNNRERESVNYTVVAMLQRVEFRNGSATVRSETELRRFGASLDHGETRQFAHALAPRSTGERVRVIYLLYKGEPPAEPTAANAYRETHLWINVSSS